MFCLPLSHAYKLSQRQICSNLEIGWDGKFNYKCLNIAEFNNYCLLERLACLALKVANLKFANLIHL